MMMSRADIGACLALSARSRASFSRSYAALVKEACLSPQNATLLRNCAARLRTSSQADDERAGDALCARALGQLLNRCYGDARSSYEAAAAAAEHAAEVTYGPGAIAHALTYGEIGPAAFLAAFRSARRISVCSHFCDLGSGRGATPLMARLVDESLTKATGVEIVPGLDAIARRAAQSAGAAVDLHLGDARDSAHWCDADVVFANWICFEPDLVADVSRALEDHLKPGAALVTFATAIQSAHFVVVEKLRRKRMGWRGPCTIFVHRKLGAEELAERLATGRPTPFDADQAIALPRPGEPYEPSDTMDSLDVAVSDDNDKASFSDSEPGW